MCWSMIFLNMKLMRKLHWDKKRFTKKGSFWEVVLESRQVAIWHHCWQNQFDVSHFRNPTVIITRMDANLISLHHLFHIKVSRFCFKIDSHYDYYSIFMKFIVLKYLPKQSTRYHWITFIQEGGNVMLPTCRLNSFETVVANNRWKKTTWNVVE